MDKIKIFYWAPFINKVATIRAVINSVTAIKNYSKNKYPVNAQVAIIIPLFINLIPLISKIFRRGSTTQK